MKKYVPLFEDLEIPDEFSKHDLTGDDSIFGIADRFFNQMYKSKEGTAIFSAAMNMYIDRIKMNSIQAKLRVAQITYDNWLSETEAGSIFSGKLAKYSLNTDNAGIPSMIRKIILDLILEKIPIVLPFFT
jgi:hypothetical protein